LVYPLICSGSGLLEALLDLRRADLALLDIFQDIHRYVPEKRL